MGEEVEELAECSICTDLFTDPRMLSCIHTFCLKCLSDTAKTTHLSAGNSMPCPLCRAPFAIPNEGMVGLRKNFFMERLVEISKVSKPSDSEIFCENCIEDDDEKATEKPTATSYCINCCKNICNRCCKEHKKYQELKEHQLVAIGSSLKEEMMKKFAVNYCEQHSKEEVKHYCLECQKVICMACYVEEHNMHKCSNLDKMADTFREELKNDLRELGDLSREASGKFSFIIEEQKNFKRRVEFTEVSIIKKGEEIKQFVDKCTDSLLEELSSIRNTQLKCLEIAEEENEQHKSIVESLEVYLKEFLSKGSSVEICRSAELLHNRYENLVNIKQKQENIVSMEVLFDYSNSLNLKTGVNIVGSIKSNSNTRLKIGPGNYVEPQHAFARLPTNVPASAALSLVVHGARTGDPQSPDWQTTPSHLDPAYTSEENPKREEKQIDNTRVVIRSSIQLNVSAADSRFSGVSKLDNEVFVVCYDPSSILVFDGHSPFQFKKKINTKVIACPFDIAAIEKSKCLFISDGYDERRSYGNRCIWKFSGDDYRVTKWLKNVREPYTISSSPDDHLLVLRQSEPINYLEIYAPEGKLIRSLSLSGVVRNPCNCIQTTNGEFIISHEDGNTNRLTISQLSNDGRKITLQFQPENVLHEIGDF